MFTTIGKGGGSGRGPREKRPRRGRPPGATERGIATRQRLYEVATRLFASHGYEATTLRDIARKASVSPGLLYRYFPSKRAVVLAVYDELSLQYAADAAGMDSGPWRDRFLFALRCSLGVLAPRRATLASLTPILVGDPDEGLFSPVTAFSRERVQSVFEEAVRGASDAPSPEDAAALGRLLYVAHLGVILWWLLDRSPRQRATAGLMATLENVLPTAALALRLEPAWGIVRAADGLCREGLFGERSADTRGQARRAPRDRHPTSGR